MMETLTFKDTVQRVGYTTINGVKVVQYTATIPSDEPQNLRIAITKLDNEMYKANRAICRADYAAFEDAVFELQDKYISELITEPVQE